MSTFWGKEGLAEGSYIILLNGVCGLRTAVNRILQTRMHATLLTSGVRTSLLCDQ